MTRRDRLRQAAGLYDLVELDAGRDLDADLLAAVEPAKRLISWRGPASDASALRGRFRKLAAVEARLYRLVVEGRRPRDGLAALEFLQGAGRGDVVAYAEGEAGLWSRVLAPQWGAHLVFGSIGGGTGMEGEPAVSRLIEDFGFPELAPVARIYGIAGLSVAHSLSPRLHNSAYRPLGLPAVFLPFAAESFAELWDDLIASGAMERLGVSIAGLTVSAPHKEAAAARATWPSPAVRHVGAANLVYRRRGGWIADSSDAPGVARPLARRGLTCAGRKAAVIGCGGSGRAIARALRKAGAEVVLSNRSRERGEWAARRLGLPLVPLAEFSAEGFNLIVNATPVGRSGDGTPFDVARLRRGTIVVDLVYADGGTPLARAARVQGATLVDGREVLLFQAMRQFARMTNHVMPERLAAGILGLDEDDPGRRPNGDRAP
jgi:3-dehydroquinate dehydratase/shikimate dehydrogenase